MRNDEIKTLKSSTLSERQQLMIMKIFLSNYAYELKDKKKDSNNNAKF